jgi:hypothetical protein
MKLKNTNYLPWNVDLLSHVMKLKNTNYLPWIFVLFSHVMKLKNTNYLPWIFDLLSPVMKLKNTNYLPWNVDLLSHVMKLKNTNYLPWIFVLFSHVMKLKRQLCQIMHTCLRGRQLLLKHKTCKQFRPGEILVKHNADLPDVYFDILAVVHRNQLPRRGCMYKHIVVSE